MVTQEVELSVSPTALLTRCADQPFAFTLDGGDQQSWGVGRAIFGFAPRETLRVSAGGATVVCGAAAECGEGDPFAVLERFCRRWAAPGVPAWAGGVLAALSYDLRTWVERVPQRCGDARGLPVLHAAFYDWLLTYSYAEQRYQLASAHRSRSELRAIAGQLMELARLPAPRRPEPLQSQRGCVRSNFTRCEYLSAIEHALEYIAAGDIYQVNLAQQFELAGAVAPAALFAAMQRDTVPFAAYVDAGDFALLSNSPECFLTRRGSALATFPVKGTRPRGADRSSDGALIRELLDDPKERAEHVMIVDLERNDLGRVCRTGSVRVDELTGVRSFPRWHHLVSTVRGEIEADVGLAEILRATFPGGSISGAPKVRAMEIIDELEPIGRGFYTGAIGFIDLTGDAVFNLAIRTAVATPQTLTYHAGGGIVADSLPAREYAETLLKAQPFFRGLDVSTR
jgi:para-aminobenzoate synthetase component I